MEFFNACIDKIGDVLAQPKLIGVEYSADRINGDFKTYLDRMDLLIIYNENFGQFLDKTDCRMGGGNGFMRAYRSDSTGSVKKTAFILGIPTGMGKLTDETNSLNNRVIIDTAIKQIDDCVKDNKIKYILWAVDSSGGLGLEIFGRSADVKENAKYITDRLKEKYANRFYYPDKTAKGLDGTFFDITQLPRSS